MKTGAKMQAGEVREQEKGFLPSQRLPRVTLCKV